jgi:hypothetical protein
MSGKSAAFFQHSKILHGPVAPPSRARLPWVQQNLAFMLSMVKSIKPRDARLRHHLHALLRLPRPFCAMLIERKFTRDTHRARLDWMKAKMFVGGSGGVTERNMAIEVSEEIARKGQELREMTRDLDLLKVDVDLIAIAIRSRGVSAANRAQAEDLDGDSDGHGATTAG